MHELVKNFGIIGNGTVSKSVYKALHTGNYDVIHSDDCIVLNCTRKDIEQYSKWCKYCFYTWVQVNDSSFIVERWSSESENKQFKLEKSKSYPIEELTLVFPSLKCLQNTKKLNEEQNGLLSMAIDDNRTGHSRYVARSKFNFSYYGKFYGVHD